MENCRLKNIKNNLSNYLEENQFIFSNFLRKSNFKLLKKDRSLGDISIIKMGHLKKR
jgi:hypothetical protein